ncbi:ATP-binding protein [Amycolatopsis sp. OK19-0408]|uniref:ATP-binding protein n=1 Tax=Amycolatopsis iheyensis TaxID=2945988 RepID=A0A9X2NKU6_9PSEU|nr:tetratricopeptide repeat protein [Amycolatopsis iheyensis]MCR6490544.1 ATP-binding protein [Amycolatopsis iheyensis]
MAWERVAAVTGRGGPGSGYVVGPRLVLTSAHVVSAGGAQVTVFRPGRTGSFTAHVLWCGTAGGRDDAALVLVDDLAWPENLPGAVRWGRSITHRPGIECECWGVPNTVQRPNRPIDVEQLTGTLNPGDRLVTDRYVMRLDGHPPEGDCPWGGLSGAAMFCDDLLTAVIAAEPGGRAHAVLEAVPVSLLLRDPGFAAVVQAHGGDVGTRCEAIELQGIADPLSRSPGRAANTSPAGLLAARRAVVPFHGREALLRELDDWVARPGVGAWLAHGPGGQGKTRLAHHFANRVGRQGWAVLWLEADASARALGVLRDTRVPVLVVCDYAEGRADQLNALAQVLLTRASDVPVKVLMLARTASSWWQQLPVAGELAADFVDLARVTEVPVLDGTRKSRLGSYRAAVQAFAAAIGETAWTAAAASLINRPERRMSGDSVLAVQMTALADLLDATTSSSPPPDSGRGLEDRLLDHERRHWLTTARTAGLPALPAAILDEVVTAATVLGPVAVDRLDGVLARVPAIRELSATETRAVREWLLQIYPVAQPRVFTGLVPDRLTERLVGRVMLDSARASVVDALAGSAREADAERLLTVVARAASHAVFGQHVADELTALCGRHRHVLAAAISVAPRVEDPAPLVRALEALAADGNAGIETLRDLVRRIPTRSGPLAETAAMMESALVGKIRRILPRSTLSPNLSLRLNNLSMRLAILGRHKESLAAIVEATNIRRQLVTQLPGPYLRDLADGLTVHSVVLGRLQRYEEGLVVSVEATQIYRQLFGRRAVAPPLAHGLSTMAEHLYRLRRPQEALEAIGEAVAIYRVAVAVWPMHSRDLATSLVKHSQCLAALSQHEDAIAAATEAVQVSREFEKREPDAAMVVLAGSLTQQWRLLEGLGRRREALAAITEAASIYARLVDGRPALFLPVLARAIRRQRKIALALGRHREAMAAMEILEGASRKVTGNA